MRRPGPCVRGAAAAPCGLPRVEFSLSSSLSLSLSLVETVCLNSVSSRFLSPPPFHTGTRVVLRLRGEEAALDGQDPCADV